jgi:hypothetical protein
MLSSSSPSQLAMQEAVSVLLYMAQDDTSSSGGDSPQVIPFDHLISLAILVMLAFASLHGLCCFNRSVKMAGLCVSQQAVLIPRLHNGVCSSGHIFPALCDTCTQASHPHFDCSVMAQHGLARNVVCKLFDSACSALMRMITRAYQRQDASCDGVQGRLSLVYAVST